MRAAAAAAAEGSEVREGWGLTVNVSLYRDDGRFLAVGCARVFERWVEDGWANLIGPLAEHVYGLPYRI